MSSFIDTKNRTWTVRITNGALRKVRDVCHFNLADMSIDDKGVMSNLGKLAEDPVLLVDVLWLCSSCTDNVSVTTEDFGESLVGDVIDEATFALMEALADYYPTRIRLILTRTVQEMKEQVKIQTEAVKKIVSADSSESMPNGQE